MIILKIWYKESIQILGANNFMVYNCLQYCSDMGHILIKISRFWAKHKMLIITRIVKSTCERKDYVIQFGSTYV